MKTNATAKHMELYAKLKGLLEKPETKESFRPTADELFRIHMKGQRIARKRLREEGYGGWYDREEIEGILQYAKEEGIIEDFDLERIASYGAHQVFKADLKALPDNCIMP